MVFKYSCALAKNAHKYSNYLIILHVVILNSYRWAEAHPLPRIIQDNRERGVCRTHHCLGSRIRKVRFNSHSSNIRCDRHLRYFRFVISSRMKC